MNSNPDNRRSSAPPPASPAKNFGAFSPPRATADLGMVSTGGGVREQRIGALPAEAGNPPLASYADVSPPRQDPLAGVVASPPAPVAPAPWLQSGKKATPDVLKQAPVYNPPPGPIGG